MKSLYTKYFKPKSIFIFGILFLHLSSCQTLSEESLEYVNREEILEDFVIIESSKDVESSTLKEEGKSHKQILFVVNKQL